MKVFESKVERLNSQRVEIDEIQCGFMSGRATSNAILIARHLQYKQLTAKTLSTWPSWIWRRRYVYKMSCSGQCTSLE